MNCWMKPPIHLDWCTIHNSHWHISAFHCTADSVELADTPENESHWMWEFVPATKFASWQLANENKLQGEVWTLSLQYVSGIDRWFHARLSNWAITSEPHWMWEFISDAAQSIGTSLTWWWTPLDAGIHLILCSVDSLLLNEPHKVRGWIWILPQLLKNPITLWFWPHLEFYSPVTGAPMFMA